VIERRKLKLAFARNQDYHYHAMTKLKAHFDGNVLVPYEPVDLPVNCELEVQIQVTGQNGSGDKPLEKLARALGQLEPNPDWPADGAAQHDHYLYAAPTSGS
jgi:hypothetical protein